MSYIAFQAQPSLAKTPLTDDIDKGGLQILLYT